MPRWNGGRTVKHRHPLRDLPLHVYRRIDGAMYIAHFADLRVSPITFFDETEAGVIAKAEEWRTEQADRHEATYSARMDNIEKARAAREKAKEKT